MTHIGLNLACLGPSLVGLILNADILAVTIGQFTIQFSLSTGIFSDGKTKVIETNCDTSVTDWQQQKLNVWSTNFFQSLKNQLIIYIAFQTITGLRILGSANWPKEYNIFGKDEQSFLIFCNVDLVQCKSLFELNILPFSNSLLLSPHGPPSFSWSLVDRAHQLWMGFFIGAVSKEAQLQTYSYTQCTLCEW